MFLTIFLIVNHLLTRMSFQTFMNLNSLLLARLFNESVDSFR